MLEDSYLCSLNIELAQRLREQAWSTTCVDAILKSIDFVNAFKIAHYNDVIQYNSIMMLTHGDFNYAE